MLRLDQLSGPQILFALHASSFASRSAKYAAFLVSRPAGLDPFYSGTAA